MMYDVMLRLDNDVTGVTEEEAAVRTRGVTTTVLVLSAVTLDQKVAVKVQLEIRPMRHGAVPPKLTDALRQAV